VAIEWRSLQEPRPRPVRAGHRALHVGIGFHVTAGKCKAPWTRNWSTV
jgi:hypothetical protein